MVLFQASDERDHPVLLAKLQTLTEELSRVKGRAKEAEEGKESLNYGFDLP